MDWLQFFSSIIGSLAWPTAVVISVMLLRREIIRLLGRLRQFKYGDAEFEFEEKLEELEDDLKELPEPEAASDFGSRILLYRNSQVVEELERFSTNSAVFVAWLEVESAILNLARAVGLLKTNMNVLAAARALLEDEFIDEVTYRVVRELYELRNIAVHPIYARAISKSEADRFEKSARKIALVLEQRRRNLP